MLRREKLKYLYKTIIDDIIGWIILGAIALIFLLCAGCTSQHPVQNTTNIQYVYNDNGTVIANSTIKDSKLTPEVNGSTESHQEPSLVAENTTKSYMFIFWIVALVSVIVGVIILEKKFNLFEKLKGLFNGIFKKFVL